MDKTPLRVSIIETAARSNYLYGSLLNALSDEIELVSVWERSKDSTQALSQSLGVPGYTDLDQLMHETAPEIGSVSVNYHANGEVGLMAVEAGLPDFIGKCCPDDSEWTHGSYQGRLD